MRGGPREPTPVEAPNGTSRAGGEPTVWIRALTAQADCALGEGGARATLRLLVEIGEGAADPWQRALRGAGSVSDDELWSSFGTPVGVELAFARALADVQRKLLRVLTNLDLPGPEAAPPPRAASVLLSQPPPPAPEPEPTPDPATDPSPTPDPADPPEAP